MYKAIFIARFNNWGKTSIINDLYDKTIFQYGYHHPITGVNLKTRFIVDSHFNDDLGGEGWINRIQKRFDCVFRFKRTLL